MEISNGNRVDGEDRHDAWSNELNVSVKLSANLCVSTLVSRNFVVVFSKRSGKLYIASERGVSDKVTWYAKNKKGSIQ